MAIMSRVCKPRIDFRVFVHSFSIIVEYDIQLNLSTTATLGTEESGRRKEVAVIERF